MNRLTTTRRRRSRRHQRLGALVTATLLAALGAAACDGDGGDPASEPTSTTITWYASAIDRNQNDYRQLLINEFRNAHPTIKINLVTQPPNTDTIRDELIAAIPADNAPDVYLGDVIWPAEFAEAGLARPLDDDFDAEFWQRFPDELLSASRYDGKTYSVPFFVSQGMLFYRTDLVPNPPATWEELASVSRQLVADQRVTYGFLWQGAAYEGLTCNWTEFLADAGGQTIDETGHESRIDSPEAHRALQYMTDLVRDGVTPPEVTSFHESDVSQVFMSGQAAFVRGWNSGYTRMNTPSSAVYGKIGVAPLPTFAGETGPGFSTIGGWSLYVNPHSDNLDAAETFVRWLTDVPAQQILARFSHIPTNVEVRTDPTTLDNPAVEVGFQVRPVARPSQTPAYPALSRVLYTVLNRALGGEQSIDEALAEAGRQLDAELR